MIAHTTRLVGLALLSALSTSCTPAPAATAASTELREAVAYEVYAQRSAWGRSTTEVDPATLHVHQQPLRTRGAAVWEVVVPGHGPRFVVGIGGGRLWRLGGFTSNEIASFANAQLRGTEAYERDPIRILISIGNPHGSRVAFPQMGEPSDAPWEQWAAQRPGDWPRDTIVTQASGVRLVRTSVLVQLEHSHDQPWIPVAYSFVFGPDNEVLSWATREAPPLRPNIGS
jgi:hypothetical protein